MILRNQKIENNQNRIILYDIYFEQSDFQKPIVIFCHGFKGFKDWGHFDLIAQEFSKAGFVFIKFNFSMNGTTVENLTDFADLDAFGKNNFTIELDDLGCLINEIYNTTNGNKNELYLVGHSRGGGISILKTFEDNRIKKLATWASVKNIDDFINGQDIDKWKKDGVLYSFNARTRQQMPLHYQLYENFMANKTRLDIPNAAVNIAISWLIVHGTKDEAVPYSCAENLHQQNAKSELFLIEGANHTFGGKHPFADETLPSHSKILVEETIQFFNK